MTVETRQFAVKDFLTDLVAKEPDMAAALTDFGTTDEEKLACTRRVCALLEAFHRHPRAPEDQGPAQGQGQAARRAARPSDPPPPTTRPRCAQVEGGGAGGVRAEPGAQRGRASLKNSSPILQAENVSPKSRKRYRELSQLVMSGVVDEIPKDRPWACSGRTRSRCCSTSRTRAPRR